MRDARIFVINSTILRCLACSSCNIFLSARILSLAKLNRNSREADKAFLVRYQLLSNDREAKYDVI
jgi:hypothetical protein